MRKRRPPPIFGLWRAELQIGRSTGSNKSNTQTEDDDDEKREERRREMELGGLRLQGRLDRTSELA